MKKQDAELSKHPDADLKLITMSDSDILEKSLKKLNSVKTALRPIKPVTAKTWLTKRRLKWPF